MTVIAKSVTIQESLLIVAPPESVWRIFRDVERWPVWCPAVRKAKLESGDLDHAGGKFRFTVKPWWLPLEARATVVASQPPERITWGVSKNGAYAQHSFTFEAKDGGTLVTSYEVFSGPMLWALPLVMPQHRIRRMFQTWIGALKAEVERTR